MSSVIDKDGGNEIADYDEINNEVLQFYNYKQLYSSRESEIENVD